MRTREQAQQSKAELLEHVRRDAPKIAETIEQMVKGTESRTGVPVSELGFMVIIAQMTSTELIGRLAKGDNVPLNVIRTVIQSQAETLSAYFDAADKAVGEWEATDPEWV